MAVGHAPPVTRVEVLGQLRLVVDGVPVEVRGPKRRAVLALLALADGRTVTVDDLVDALWPAEIPESGRQALHSHVSRLRGHLGPASARLETWTDGYRLELGGETEGEWGLDLAQARALLSAGRRGMERDPATAYAQLRAAHALWRGPVLADLTDVEPIAAAVEACAQLHREVTDALITSAIAAGAAERVEGLAAVALAADPLREPAVLLQMRVLAATGRAAQALEVGREFRHRLADETGLDPSPALSALEREIAGGAGGRSPTRRDPATGATTRLIGREGDVAAVQRLLAAERLLTIVGPGGVGKTRVALEVARRTDTTTTLPLASVSDPAAVPYALAASLNLAVVQGDVLSACVELLGDRPGLLVIDNCEHLLDPVRGVVEVLLAGCPALTVLATSREPLGLAAEYAFRLAPLPLPAADLNQSTAAPPEDLPRVPSVAVFLDRAGRVRRGAPPTQEELRTIADIVRRLDGMPLAIELAAGRLSSLSLNDLRSRLDRSLDLLGGQPSGDPRHRTLRATIEWSYELLSEDEQRLFRHLSVFVDGIDLDAAERLAADLGLASDPGSALARLVDASMIEAHFEGGTRYRMLETLRAYGLDRLVGAGEYDAAAGRLLGWALDLTARIEDGLRSTREPEFDVALRRELPNLRAAWRLARSRESIDSAAAMVLGLFDAVSYRDLIELRGWVEELAADPAVTAHPRAAALLGIAAEAAYHRGDHRLSERLARQGLELAAGTDDAWCCLLPLSVVSLARGAYADAIGYCLAPAAFAPYPRENYGLAALATAYGGDPEGARTLNDRGLAAARSPTMVAWGAYVAGEIETYAGHREQAEPQYVRAVELARRSGATFIVGVATVGLLAARAEAGQVHEALRGYREVIDYFARTGNWPHLWVTLRNLADLLRRLGDDEPAALLHAAADQAPDPPATARADVLELAREAIDHNLPRP